MTVVYDYANLHHRLQFDCMETEIPDLQASIDAITNIKQQTALQNIRDMKVNQEYKASKRYRYEGLSSAVKACNECIRVLGLLNFNTTSLPSTELLHSEDNGGITSETFTVVIR
tara:strand:+ start:54530 stop:54871 length:342 start_codon:yes stop_codon:yes gene_type:complete